MAMSATTRSFNNYRNGANLNESVLVAEAVQNKGIKLLWEFNLPGDARGTEAMPLVVTGVTMEDGAVHDVMIISTMNNDVFGIDAKTGEQLWMQHVGVPVKNQASYDLYQIQDHWGFLSTGVIDTTTGVWYGVNFSSPDGMFDSLVYTLHALNIVDGQPAATPLPLNSAFYQPPGGAAPLVLGATQRKQRSALALDSRNGVTTVFFAASSFAMNGPNAHGWLIACDVSAVSTATPALEFAAGWTTTVKNPGSGVWMASQGVAVDDEGFVYLVSGNGAFDGITDFGESVCKLSYMPKGSNPSAEIKLVSSWTPYTDAQRCGLPSDTPYLYAVSSQATYPTGSEYQVSPTDQDLGSGMVLLLPSSFTGYQKNAAITAGKDGIAYVLDTDNMGTTTLADLAPETIAGNYAKLLSPPVGFPYYPGNLDLTPTNPVTLPTTHYGLTHHCYGSVVAYKSARFGVMIFVGGDNAPVRVFSFNADYTLTYLGCGTEIASALVPPPGGGLGCNLSLSANGIVEDTAVLWALIPDGDANKSICNGRLVAYGADWIDPTGTLVKLWDSATWGIEFKHDKMAICSAVNGILYVPTYDARVLAFGLAS